MTTTTTARQRPGKFSWRGFTAMLLIAMAIMIILSGVTLYFSPAGRFIAGDATTAVAAPSLESPAARVPPRQGQAASAEVAVDWRVLGLDKEGWEAVHNTFTMLWLPVLAVHVWMNRKAVLVHLRGRLNEARRFRWEAIGALVVTALLMYSVLAGTPPSQQIVALREAFHEGAGLALR